MPVIKIKHIASFSSEESGYKADNLLNDDATRKWKCASGETQASVVFQLEKSTLLSSIDIGNDGSAFIEVLVGRSSRDNVQYQVILVASSFMSPQESRLGSPPNRVRIFGKDKLVPDIASQKWDLVKIVCTQPFNKRTAYGVSFIKLHTLTDDIPETKAETITDSTKSDENKKGGRKSFGAFKVKEEKKEEPEAKPLNMGMRMMLYNMAKKGNWSMGPDQLGQIKTAEEARAIIKHYDGDSEPAQSRKRRSTSPLEKEIEEKRRKVEQSSSQSISTPIKFDTLKQKKARNTPSKNSSTSRPESSNIRTSHSATKKESSSKKKTAKKRVALPYGEILNGVIFVISGFQNPLRSELRDKALGMGAQYRRDWTSDSTHLVCAFPHTPKYRQVMGCGGKIVKKEWVNDCASRRQLLSWKKYSMDPNQSDESSSEVEDEIETEEKIVKSDEDKSDEEEVDDPYGASTDDEDGDTEDEIEKIQAEQANGQIKKEVVEDVYDASTDEEDATNDDAELPSLPDYLNDKQFMLYGNFSPDIKRLAKRHIIACGGKLSEYMSDDVEYVITERTWDNKFDQALADNASLIFVKPNWLFQCGIKNQLIPYQPYIVSPS